MIPKQRYGRVAGPLLATAAAVAVATALIPAFAGGASHREAPAISFDPAADNTDVYAFVSPDTPSTATLIANYIPFEEPSGGPNYFRFSEDVLYEINIDNTGDGAEDIRYEFRFTNSIASPNTFLYNTGPVTFNAQTGEYENLNLRSRYDVTRVEIGPGGAETRTLVGDNLRAAPSNVGPKSMPDYTSLAQAAIQPLAGGGQVFAGQRDDPFFIDLGATFDLLNFAGRTPGQVQPNFDAFTGFNVHTLALQIPKEDLSASGQVPTDASSVNSVIGVYASASRSAPNIVGGAAQATQVSRMANPLINEVVIGLGQKDLWNASDPAADSQFEQRYLDPVLAELIRAVFGVEAPLDGRIDLTTILLTGLPPGNPTGLVTQIGTNPAQADLLRLNLAVPPAANPNRLGLLGGDPAGFPNGRRLIDDVVDIEVQVVAGVVAPLFGIVPDVPEGAGTLTDNVNVNDRAFLPSFPYVAPPVDGFNVAHPRPSTTPYAPADGAVAPACEENSNIPQVERGPGGNPDDVTLSARQLLINQRISQAAVRRANEGLDNFSMGLTADDIRDCTVSLEDFEAVFRQNLLDGEPSSGGVVPVEPPRPSPERSETREGDNVVLSRIQLLINQRISQAAIRRVNALRARLDAGITGGDIRRGTLDASVFDTQMRNLLGGGAPSASTVDVQIEPITPAPPGPRDPESVTLSRTQLLINQRIAQEAVHRSNQIRAELRAGLVGIQIRDGSLVRANLTPELQRGSSG